MVDATVAPILTTSMFGATSNPKQQDWQMQSAARSRAILNINTTLHNGVPRKTKNNASRGAWQAKEKRYDKLR